MKILFVYALEEEKGDITVNGHQLFFCKTGIGKVQAAIAVAKAVQEIQPDLVINFGSAGTITHEVGDILVCRKFVDRDLTSVAIPDVVCELDFINETANYNIFNSDYTVNTGDSFVTEISDSLKKSDAIDMEAFAIAAFCKQNSLPFISIKFVSDIVGRNSLKAWSEKLSDTRVSLSAFINNLKL